MCLLRLSVKTSREGMMTYSGTIKMKSPKGKDVVFPFKSEYIVARPALTVAAEKMNVVYQGLDNPISVSVPGVPNERLSVSVTPNAKLKNSGNGKYIMSVSGGLNVDVNVFATMDNGEKRNMGTMTFRVRRIPKPDAKVAGITSDGIIKREELEKERGVFAQYDNFEFNVVCKVTSFEMVYPYQGLQIALPGTGNLLTDEMRAAIKKLKKNVGDVT